MIHVDPEVCVLCGLCTGVCPPNALELEPNQLKVLDHCTDCGWCVPYCPVGALSGGRLAKGRSPVKLSALASIRAAPR